MSSETPETLFRRFLDSGCEAALDTLIRRCSPRLRGFARRFGVADDRVEDLVQETMITAVQRAASWHDDRPLLPWLQGILTRKIASWARDEARRRHHHASWAEARRPDSTDPADDVEGDELRALLCAAIAAVPERYRRALELHLLHGLAPHEVAARLGRMRATVRVHLHRGLQRVRRHLPRGVHPLLLALALAPTVRPRAAAVRPQSGAAATLGLAAAITGAALAVGLGIGNSETTRPSVSPTPTAPESALAAAAGGEPDRPAAHRRGPEPARATNAAARRLQVTVRDPAGRALAGVGVSCEILDGGDPLANRRRELTDAAGRVEFEALADARLRLRTDRGHDRTVAGDATAIELTAAGIDVRGIVVDEFGRPVAGAQLWLGHGSAAGVVAVADDTGGFALTAVPQTAAIAAIAPFSVAPPRAIGDAVAPLELRLEPAGAVHGVVLDDRGAPLANVRVVTGPAPEYAEQGFPDDVLLCAAPTQSTVTDGQGRFGPFYLPPGEHGLHARAPFHRAAASTAAVRAGETADCQLAMARAARVRGRVVDAAGAPIAAAELAFRGPDRNDRADLPVDRAGRFDFDATAAGGELAVRAPGFTSARRRLAPDSGPWLDVAIRLEPEPQLALRLAFPDGTAAAGWAVRWCSEPDSALAPSEQQVATDATGECRIAAPLGAAPARWAVRGPGDPVWHRMPVAALARDGEARRRATVPTDLLPSATLTATCLGVDDRPLQNARVYLQLHDDTAWESARTDDRGRFAAGPLAPGSYTVFAESTAPDQPTLRHTGALLQAGGHAELELRAGSSGVLDYALRRADDRPIRAAVVTFVGGSPARRYGARESASGRQRLPAGDYALYAMGEDFAWIDGTPFTIVADETLRLELPVEPAARRALALQGVPGLGERLFVAELRRRSDRRPFGSFRILRDAPPSLNAFLPRGDYELDLRALADDRAWHGGFTVESVAPRHAAIAVPLAPR